MTSAKTTLITAGNETDRREAATKLVENLLNEKAPQYDFLELDGPKICHDEEKKHVGIEHSRELTKFFKTKPLQHSCKVALILEAQLLTVEAQNALLKTLEEPPASAYIILTAPKKTDLLPTVISRCRQIRLDIKKSSPPTFSASEKGSEAKLSVISPKSQFLDWVSDNKDLLENKEELLKTIAGWESGLRDQLLTPQTPTASIKHLTSAISDLWQLRETLENTSVNTRLAVEEFLLKL